MDFNESLDLDKWIYRSGILKGILSFGPKGLLIYSSRKYHSMAQRSLWIIKRGND